MHSLIKSSSIGAFTIVAEKAHFTAAQSEFKALRPILCQPIRPKTNQPDVAQTVAVA